MNNILTLEYINSAGCKVCKIMKLKYFDAFHFFSNKEEERYIMKYKLIVDGEVSNPNPLTFISDEEMERVKDIVVKEFTEYTNYIYEDSKKSNGIEL